MPSGNAADTSAEASPLSLSSSDVPPSLGRFQILGRLGVGAFGAVYRGYDPLLDREVAIKVPRAGVLKSPEARARFLREPKAAAHLRHPHIVPVYDAGSDGDQYYIAAAFIAGRTLEEVMEKERLDCSRAAAIVRDLADALHYAHGAGVVHRDVKPANIMLDERGQAMLTDFGLARLENEEQKLTQDGSIMGTPAYLAPEQADRSFGEVGPASDQYSLGMVLYELLCGVPPFQGPPAVVIFNAIHRLPDRPRSVDPSIPRDLETICLKAIQKQPNQRYADCGQLADDLRRWQDDRPICARRQRPMERIARWMRRNPLAAALTGAVALVTFIGLLAVTWQWQRAEGNRRQADDHRERAETALAQANDLRIEAEENAAQAAFHQREAEAAQRRAEENLAEIQRQKTEAERQRAAAAAAQKSEAAERLRAEQASGEAQSARHDAVESLDEVKRQRLLAQQRERIVRRHLYAAEMNLAMQAWETGNPERAEELLAKQVPRSMQDEDLRAFEWYYLAGQQGFRGQPKAKVAAEVFHHRDVIYQARVAADNSLLVSLGRDRTAKVWDVAASVPKGMLALPKGFVWGAYAQPVEHANLASHFGLPLAAVQSLNVFGRCSFPIVSPRCGAMAVATAIESVSPHAPIGSRSSYLRIVKFWQINTQAQIAVIRDCWEPIAFSPDDRLLAVAKVQPLFVSQEHTKPWDAAQGLSPQGIALIDAQNGADLGLLVSDWIATNVCFSPDGRRLAVVERKPKDFSLERPLLPGLEIMAPPQPVRPQSEDLRRLPPERLRIFDIESRLPRPLQLTFAPEAKTPVLLPSAIAFTRHGEKLIGLQQRQLRLWDVNGYDSELLGEADGNALLVSPDGCSVVVWTQLSALDLEREKEAAELAQKEKAKARERLKLETRKAVLIFDLIDKRLRAQVTGHRWAIRACAYSADSSTLATASEDGTVKLWDVVTGAEKYTLRGHENGILTLAFADNGAALISGGRDGTLRMWCADRPNEQKRDPPTASNLGAEK